MGINATIYDGIRSQTYQYNIEPDDIDDFLLGSWYSQGRQSTVIRILSRLWPTPFPQARFFSRRQAQAISIIEDIMINHGKRELLGHVVQLAKVEYGIRTLEPWVRDHVVHALLSFLLGIYLNEHALRPSNNAVDSFQWKIAGLFHDVGYPAQIAMDILKPYTDRINKIKEQLRVTRPDVLFRVVPIGLDELGHGANAFQLIQGCMNTWGLAISARDEYDRMISDGRVCHGIISALSVLYVIDLMYEKFNETRARVDIYEPPGINWNQVYFEDDVVPACAAIFVHNLPARCFISAKIDPGRAPLAFLLRLADCLQDWDRPSATDPLGVPNSDFDIEVSGDRVEFSIANPDRRRKIDTELRSALVADSIIIT